MRYAPLFTASVGFAAIIVTSACADSNAPISASSFDLATYAGQPLPFVLRRIAEISTETGGPTTYCDDELTASHLRLIPSNRFVQTDSSLVVCDDGRPDFASRSVLQGTYTVGRDTVLFGADLGDDVHYLGTAQLGSGILTIIRRQSFGPGGTSTTDATQLVFRASQ